MNPQAPSPEYKSWPWGWAVLAAAVVIALCSAHNYAGGWNDGSRLATVESLVDHHTWSIDASIFVRPSAVAPGAPSPYLPSDRLSVPNGTRDKLFINGLYYSDKSPVPSLWLAAVYAALQFCTGWTARANADAFCYVLTLAASGLAYVVAVWSIYRLGRPLSLPHPWPLLLAGSFALATIALPYLRHVNNHILLLGVVSPLMVEMAWIARGAAVTWARLLRLGLLAGLSYTIDIGTGPVLLGGAALWLAFRVRRPAAWVMFALAAAPWVLLHHGLNYAIGGTLGPANGVSAYFDWPGCPFNVHTMTGVWSHAGLGSLVRYSLDLLVGKQGFLTHNLALWLAIPACWWLCRRPSADRPELLLSAGWCIGTWLLYSLSSTNHSGACCSIRWFVPLLAPAYYVLAVWLRDCPARYLQDFSVLSVWGMALGSAMWCVGPWWPHPVPGFWAILAAASASLGVTAYLRWRRQPTSSTERATERRAA